MLCPSRQSHQCQQQLAESRQIQMLHKTGDFDNPEDILQNELTLSTVNPKVHNQAVPSTKQIIQPLSTNQSLLNTTNCTISTINQGYQSFDKAYKNLANQVIDQENYQNELPIEYETSNGEKVNILSLLGGTKTILQNMEKAQNTNIVPKVVKQKEVITKTVKQPVQNKENKDNKSFVKKPVKPSVEKELKENCTFAPQVNKKKNQKKRTLDEFLLQQNQFLAKKEEVLKLQNQEKDKEQQQSTFQPQINQKSKNLLKNRQKNNRIYDKKKEELEKQMQEQKKANPSISKKSQKIVRTEKVENLLYQDAIRRQEMSNLIQNSQSIMPKGKPQTFTSTTSEQILTQKFIKSFESAVNSQLESDQTNKLSKQDISLILSNLGFLKRNFSKNKQDNNKKRNAQKEKEGQQLQQQQNDESIENVWITLKGNEFDGILKENLCIFLLCVIGLHSNFPQSLNQNQEENSLGIFDEETEEWEISQKEAIFIQQSFDSLYRNKLTNEQMGQVKEHQEQNTYQPKVLPTSKALASNYREKLLEETAVLLENNEININLLNNGKISHIDLLIIQKQAQKQQHEKEHKKKLAEEEQAYSFKPKIHSKCEFDQKKQLGFKNKAEQLYSLAKEKQQKADKTSQDIDFEKNSVFCTFAPNTSKYKSQYNSNNKQFQNKDVDKAIMRMRLARKEKEKINQWHERGYPKTLKVEHEDFTQLYSKKAFSTQQSQMISQETEIGQELSQKKQQLGNKMQKQSLEKQESENQIPQMTDEQIYNEYNQLISNLTANSFQSFSEYKAFKNQQQDFIQEEQNLEDQEEYDDEYEEDGSKKDLQQYFEETLQTQMLENSPNKAQSTQEMAQDQLSDFEENEEQNNEENYANENQMEEEEEEEEDDDELAPLLYVDVNLGPTTSKRIIIYPGDTACALAENFAKQYNLDNHLKKKLTELLENQISGVLTKIDEEQEDQYNSSDEKE